MRHAALPTAVSLAAIVLLWRGSTGGTVPLALAVLLALTFPHLRSVALLDRTLARDARPAPTAPG